MKRIMSIFLIVAVVFMLSGCNLLKQGDDESEISGEYKNVVITNGIGRTVNAITGNYIETYSGAKPVFDSEKLSDLRIIETPLQTTNATSFHTSSMSEFNEEFGTQITGEIGIEKKGLVFTSSMKTAFDFTTHTTKRTSTQEMYYTLQQNVVGNRIEVEGYRDTSTFTDVLNDDFIADIEKVKDGTLTAADFIDYYGTHVIVSGYFGGRLSCYFYLISNETSYSSSKSSDIAVKLSSGIGRVVHGEASSTISNEINESLNESSTEYHFSANGVGGAFHSLGDLDSFSSNYEAWANSFNESDDYSVLVDIAEDGLIPIWKLFPEEYSDTADVIESSFITLATNEHSAFLDNYNNLVDDGDIINFAGGTGTASNPYLISTAAHLKKVDQFEAANVYFKLQNDINVTSSNWVPIGSATAPDGQKPTDPFNGTFDGNGKTITYNLDINTSVAADDQYFGLFGSIENAVIKNVKVDAKITTSSIFVFLGPDRFAGGVVGYSISSTIVNCQNNSTSSDRGINLRNKYMAAAGGIVGVAYNSTITNCMNHSEILATGLIPFVGGIVGLMSDTSITTSSNDATLIQKNEVTNLPIFVSGLFGHESDQAKRFD